MGSFTVSSKPNLTGEPGFSRPFRHRQPLKPSQGVLAPFFPKYSSLPTGDTIVQSSAGPDIVVQDARQDDGHPPAADAIFHWKRQWYPVAFEKDMDGSRPTSITLLNEKLVLWKDTTSGSWNCLEDRCPHRHAPLSEGKVWTDGTLMCSYHGWRFQGASGRCVSIPQADTAELEAQACASPRSCAQARPVKVVQGLLWVWGGGSKNDETTLDDDPHQVPLAVDPYLEEALAEEEDLDEAVAHTRRPRPKVTVLSEITRDLVYDYSTLIENVLDPSHVPFSHHGIQGNRDRVTHGMYTMKRDESARVSHRASLKKHGGPNPHEIASSFVGLMRQGRPGVLSFMPPCLAQYSSTLPGKDPEEWFTFSLYCVPTEPGRSRLLARQVARFSKLPLVFTLARLVPTWWDHMSNRVAVLDGDMVFLHEQEHDMAEAARQRGDEDSSGWKKAFYCPFQTDTMIVAFRNWLDRVGGGGPHGPLHKARGHKESRLHSKEEILDRFRSHTMICSECRKAYGRWKVAQQATGMAAAVTWAAAVALLVVFSCGGSVGAGGWGSLMPSSRVRLQLGLTSALGLCLTWAYRLCCSMVQGFIFQDYVHNER